MRLVPLMTALLASVAFGATPNRRRVGNCPLSPSHHGAHNTDFYFWLVPGSCSDPTYWGLTQRHMNNIADNFIAKYHKSKPRDTTLNSCISTSKWGAEV